MASESISPIVSKSNKGSKSSNEDAEFTWISLNSITVIGAVFDGHGGHNGLLASFYCKNLLQAELDKVADVCETWSPSTWSEFLTKFYELAHNGFRAILFNQPNEIFSFIPEFRYKSKEYRTIDLKGVVRDQSNDPVHGGTTATIIVNTFYESTSYLITSNCGDSEAFVVGLDKPDEPIELTKSHSPDDVDEFERIRDLDLEKYPKKLLFVYDQNNVHPKYNCSQVFNPDGSKIQKYVDNPWKKEYNLHASTVRYDPSVYAVSPRDYNLQDKTCIAITRAIGDFYAHPLGLTYIPTITISEITNPASKLIVIASDGIWDCWKYEEFSTEFANKYTLFVQNQNASTNPIESVLDHIMAITETKANQLFGSNSRDDQTMVIIKPHISRLEHNSIEERIASEIINSIIQQVITNSETDDAIGLRDVKKQKVVHP
jgi:serine/threonine protein phosphatase PrpC